MLRALAALSRGALHLTPQPDAGVTYARKITKEEAALDGALPAPPRSPTPPPPPPPPPPASVSHEVYL